VLWDPYELTLQDDVLDLSQEGRLDTSRLCSDDTMTLIRGGEYSHRGQSVSMAKAWVFHPRVDDSPGGVVQSPRRQRGVFVNGTLAFGPVDRRDAAAPLRSGLGSSRRDADAPQPAARQSEVLRRA